MWHLEYPPFAFYHFQWGARRDVRKLWITKAGSAKARLNLKIQQVEKHITSLPLLPRHVKQLHSEWKCGEIWINPIYCFGPTWKAPLLSQLTCLCPHLRYHSHPAAWIKLPEKGKTGGVRPSCFLGVCMDGWTDRQMLDAFSTSVSQGFNSCLAWVLLQR